MNRDSRLKPDRGETGTGSIGEADESGGARSAIAQPQSTNPKTPNTHIGRIVEGLNEFDRSLLLGTAEGWGSWMFTSGEYMCSLGLGTYRNGSIAFDTPLAESVRTYLESMEGGNG